MLAVPVVLLACSLQVTAKDCAVEFIHHYDDAPQDWTEGHVLTRGGHQGYHNPSDAWGAVEFEVQNCASGERVLVRTSEEDGSEDVFNVSTSVEARLNEIQMNEAPSNWVSILESEARSLGAKIRLSGISEKESCGRRVFYPELRGDKEPYKV
jgi:hypothetical protein